MDFPTSNPGSAQLTLFEPPAAKSEHTAFWDMQQQQRLFLPLVYLPESGRQGTIRKGRCLGVLHVPDKLGEQRVRKDRILHHGLHQQTEDILPLLSVRNHPMPMLKVHNQVSHLVDIGNQEQTGFKVIVDGDAGLMSLPHSEITRFGMPAFAQLKVKRIFLPQRQAIGAGCPGYAASKKLT